MIQEVFSSAEIESFSLTNSSPAVTHRSRENVGAIFLDVRMPSPDDVELTQQICTGGLNRATPIVIVTGDEDRAVLSRACKAGATFFLCKLVDRHGILRRIRITGDSIQREARRFERVRIRCKVSLELGQEQVRGWTPDLRLSGLFVRASRALNLGSTARPCRTEVERAAFVRAFARRSSTRRQLHGSANRKCWTTRKQEVAAVPIAPDSRRDVLSTSAP